MSYFMLVSGFAYRGLWIEVTSCLLGVYFNLIMRVSLKVEMRNVLASSGIQEVELLCHS